MQAGESSWNGAGVGPIYEGKGKCLYRTDEVGVLRMVFKDDATAFNAQKRAEVAGKGRVNVEISTRLFELLEAAGVRTHFLAQEDEVTMLVREVEIVPLEVIVRNCAAGSFCRRTGLAEGVEFGRPVVEWSLKDDDLGDPLVNDDYVRVLGLASEEELGFLRGQALRVNEVLGEVFGGAGMKLVDFKVEFGRVVHGSDAGVLILADEVSPDSCRLWDADSGEKLDKDRFRHDLGDLMEGYRDVLGRVRGLRS